MWSSAHLPLCNRPNRAWLIVISNCQINSHRSRVQMLRLHVNFRVVCKISYRWGRLSAWCLHMRVFVFLNEYWQWASIFAHTVKWSRMVEQLRPISCQVCIFAMQGTGNVSWHDSLHCVPQPRLRWVTVLPVGDHSSGFTRACSISYEDDFELSYEKLFEFV